MEQIQKFQRIIEIKDFLKSKGKTEKTIRSYCMVIQRVIFAIGEKFTEEQLENLFTKWNLKSRTYNMYRCIMNFYTKKYLNYPLTFSKASVENSLPTKLTKEEFFNVLRYIKNFKHKIGLTLMYFSGLRVSEVCRLRKDDIDLQNQIIWVRQGKGKKDRRSIIPNQQLPYIKNYCNKIKDYLFPTYRGHISERSFEAVLDRAIKASKITKRFHLHDLRHNFAINCVNKNINLEDVRKMLGHVKLSTTQIYLQCRDSNLTEIARCV